MLCEIKKRFCCLVKKFRNRALGKPSGGWHSGPTPLPPSEASKARGGGVSHPPKSLEKIQTASIHGEDLRQHFTEVEEYNIIEMSGNVTR